VNYFKVFDEKLHFGFGEGGAEVSDDNTSKYLNYLDISLDVDIGKLFAKKARGYICRLVD